MIVSFHPIISGDVNRICAGRDPDGDDESLLRAADCVILPQGCGKKLYELARAYCPNVFPDYECRFRYPGKIGQIRLFRRLKIPHPRSLCFCSTEEFHSFSGRPLAYPFVFKFNWGGQGETVFYVDTEACLRRLLEKAVRFESTGQAGFLLQEYVPAAGRTLRVAVIGSRLISYWRVSASPDGFYGNLASGGGVDRESDPDLQGIAAGAVRLFCDRTKIDLAGIDIIFSTIDPRSIPQFLEINYFFGREGLGGSENYYRILRAEVDGWLKRIETRNRTK